MPANTPKKGKASKDYREKRSFDKTPEPPPEVSGDVDVSKALAGKTFVIHQHHATRLHFDLRLEMMNGRTPVLVSWAVPKNLPQKKGKPALAIKVEDHPFEYGSFSGSIPSGNYGAGAVRIFDAGNYELLEQEPDKLKFRLEGSRMKGVYNLIRTKKSQSGKQEWLAFLSEQLRDEPEPMPPAEPMLATLADEAFDDDAWFFEPKWDGVRAIATCDTATQLMSRNSKDITGGYPELHKMHEQLVAFDAMVDGEIVAMDGGVPSFEKLQSRMHVRNPKDVERLARTTPVTFVAFDLIYLDGRSLVKMPMKDRRQLLEATVVQTPWVQLSPSIKGDGLALFTVAEEKNLEGIIAKKATSLYEPGKRSRAWLKIKTVLDADVVVGGWTHGGGNRSGAIGALLMGAYDGKEFRYVGSVGTGFDRKSLELVASKLKPLETNESPFAKESLKGERKDVRNASWVKPELVAKVEYRQLTGAGKLRAPAFKGLREDKGPKDCKFKDLGPPV